MSQGHSMNVLGLSLRWTVSRALGNSREWRIRRTQRQPGSAWKNYYVGHSGAASDDAAFAGAMRGDRTSWHRAAGAEALAEPSANPYRAMPRGARLPVPRHNKVARDGRLEIAGGLNFSESRHQDLHGIYG